MRPGFAPAKVNLALHVLGRRPDGYHLLDSLVVFADVGDMLRAVPDSDLSLDLEGPFAAVLSGDADNLVLRAARSLAAAHGIGASARLTLDKRLPVASGIGGGSADAAAALRLLADLWGVTVPDGLALRLGADVPVCLASMPARMGGVGERLTPAPHLPRCGLVLVNPGVAVSTPAVFAARRGGFSPPLDLPETWQDVAAMADDLARAGNDLEAAAVTLSPVIGTVLDTLRALSGCRLARMSGSGATCFGLFADPGAASLAAARCPPEWWAWGGGLAEGVAAT